AVLQLLYILSMAQNIPYLGPINGGLREGTSIYIQGTIPKHITRFFINLICGESESSDIALHFNPRFDGWDKVVFNTCQNGSWGSEDKIHKMPFRKGEHFEMIKVNGNDFHTFQHRIPMEQVRGLQIAGDVSIQTINFIGVRPQLCESSALMLRALLGKINEAKIIKSLHSTSLAVDIAFHMNPRLREGIVVRNSMIGGNWGQEEREMSMNPFMEGQYFDMSIRCGNQRFKVFVNGQHLFDFFHRWQSFNEIDMLEIEGDVQISYIHF
uniref:Galectin n=1 Tax=Oreochromis aureus TaxID=47969 RepID=A0AAZ1XZX2_OREAU